MKLFRNTRTVRATAAFFCLLMLTEILAPVSAFALTGGPSQPEVQSFEPIGTSEMVDLFTGDFNYNIPLLDVEGYPVNISYHSGITNDQEASWVGLGWNINPGVLNRNMRGLPDDFKGDMVEKEFHMRKNTTMGITGEFGVEFTGYYNKEGKQKKQDSTTLFSTSIKVNANLGVKMNNYKGMGFEFGISPSAGISTKAGFSCNVGLSLNADSQEGFSTTPNASFGYKMESEDEMETGSIGASVSLPINSRQGLKSLQVGLSAKYSSYEQNKKEKNTTTGYYQATSNSAILFGAQTYTPSISMPFNNVSWTFHGQAGFEVKWGSYMFGATGYYSEQELDKNIISKPAYGFLYEHEEPLDGNGDFLLDFNREKDAPYTTKPSSVFLPVSSHTFDQFSASGQGMSASFRPFRSDIVVLHDDHTPTTNKSRSIGVDVAIGDVVKAGANIAWNKVYSESKKWESPMGALGFLGAYQPDANRRDPFYEPAYMKATGERTAIDQDFFISLGGYDLAGVHLDSNTYAPSSSRPMRESFNNFKQLAAKANGKVHKTKRDQRNQLISYLTAEDARHMAFTKSIERVTAIDSTSTCKKVVFDEIERTAEFRKPYHISEMTVTSNDGRRYVYGIPAYNTKQEEYTFNTQEVSSPSDGQVSYDPANDKGAGNPYGQDHFASAIRTPAYAHSYLLTAVLSADYSDLTGNGISDDDYGTAVKFNYDRKNSNYRWRVPFNEDKANYSEGYKSLANDQKGSIVYGEKEIWMLHSVETRNYIAFFELEERLDGHGVKDADGGLATDQKSYLLRRIKLYAKADFQKNGANAVPIKTVNFEYDYSLCKGVDNNNDAVNSGKLTLRKIYFTYGKSYKGKYTSYKFQYAHEEDGLASTYNPDYHMKNYDRWGNYKTGVIPTDEFPYTPQNNTEQDVNAQVWHLTRIDLPSGGTIDVNYESDDYAYVQNKQAMRMFKVLGTGRTQNPTDVSDEGRMYFKSENHNYLFFELDPEKQSTGDIEKYFQGIQDLFFNCYVKVYQPKDGGDAKYEYVRGYFQIQPGQYDKGYGISTWTPAGPLSGQSVGWVRLKMVHIANKSIDANALQENNIKDWDVVNPISKASMQFLRLQLPQLAYPGSDPNATPDAGAFRGLLGAMTEITTLFRSFNRMLRGRDCGEKLDPSRSWIRLVEPRKRKLGGGVRVKNLKMSDRWASMDNSTSGQTSAEYGQEYDYTMVEENATEATSSGVAAYEPMIGNDENPWRTPIYSTTEALLAPDVRNYVENPVGESFFPAPVVGYRQVTVRSLSNSGVTLNTTGYTVNKFYTALDFPTQVQYEPVQEIKTPKGKNFFKKLFNLETFNRVATSQGYVISVNDMHGKPKEVEEYDRNNNRYKSIRYEYSSSGNQLSNTVKTYDKSSNTISNKLVSVDFDFTLDTRNQETHTTNSNLQINFDLSLAGIVPIPIPLPWYKQTSDHLKYNSVVATKVVYTYGVQTKTVVMEEGAQITTENLLFDAETGEVLLTKTQNEFEDDIYNFTYPAHFAYEGMGQGYKNTGVRINEAFINGYDVIIQDRKLDGTGMHPSDIFYPGDEVLVQFLTGDKRTVKGWYMEDHNGKFFYDINGQVISKNDYRGVRLTIMRSGRRNMQSMPIGSVVSMVNPIDGSNNLTFNTGIKVINSSAITYSDKWTTICPEEPRLLCDSLTPQADAFMALLNKLATENQIKSTTEVNVGSYTEYQEAELVSDACLEAPCENNDTYVANLAPSGEVKGNTMRGTFEHCSNGDCLCSFTLELSNLPCNEVKGYELTFCDNIDPEDPLNCLSETYIDSVSEDEIDEYASHPKLLGQSPYSYTVCNPNLPSFTYSTIQSFSNFRRDKTSGDPNAFIVDVHFGGDTVMAAYGSMSCPDINFFEECCAECFPDNKKQLNPFVHLIRGTWRPKAEYVFYGQRNNEEQNINIRKQGVYTSFTPFWSYSGSKYIEASRASNSSWTLKNEITKYSPFGFELENRDALGRYSAALYGYNGALPVAVGSNAEYKQLAYDGFEDYPNFLGGGCDLPRPNNCAFDHWSFADQLSFGDLDITQSHSGLRSLKVTGGDTMMISRKITSCVQDTNELRKGPEYYVEACNCLGRFAPDSGKYIFSGWVKSDTLATIDSYQEISVVLSFRDRCYDEATAVILKPDGPVIEGWQRVYGSFTVPQGTRTVELSLTTQGSAAWFDDLRIHPYNSNMKSFVYDPVSRKLLAELDENNYTSFYEYDQEGILVRVKKETERGIMTIQESRNSNPKK